MAMEWATIRERLYSATMTQEMLPWLLSEALGEGPDWMVVFDDWLRRWNVTGCRGTDNVIAFLRDSLEPSVSDPEAAAILATIRTKCYVIPRSGVGLTAVESLGEIRQTIREFADKRAAELRHRSEPGDMAEPETAEDMRRMLCSLVTRLADKMNGHVDCFCGRCPVTSETVAASFRDRYQVTPGVLVVLAAFVESYSGGNENGDGSGGQGE